MAVRLALTWLPSASIASERISAATAASASAANVAASAAAAASLAFAFASAALALASALALALILASARCFSHRAARRAIASAAAFASSSATARSCASCCTSASRLTRATGATVLRAVSTQLTALLDGGGSPRVSCFVDELGASFAASCSLTVPRRRGGCGSDGVLDAAGSRSSLDVACSLTCASSSTSAARTDETLRVLMRPIRLPAPPAARCRTSSCICSSSVESLHAVVHSLALSSACVCSARRGGQLCEGLCEGLLQGQHGGQELRSSTCRIRRVSRV